MLSELWVLSALRTRRGAGSHGASLPVVSVVVVADSAVRAGLSDVDDRHDHRWSELLTDQCGERWRPWPDQFHVHMLNVVDAYAQSIVSGALPAGKYAAIYQLMDSREKDHVARIRYVGRTTSPLARRLSRHLYAARIGRTFALASWIRSVEADNGSVLIEAIRFVPISDADAAEVQEIANARKSGCDLLNQTIGGIGMTGFRPSDETRRKIGAAATGRRLSHQQKERIRLFMRGRVVSDETRARLRVAAERRRLSA